MEKSKAKLGILIFLSNIFLYLGLNFNGDNWEKVILPLQLNFKNETTTEKFRIKIYDSFGEFITDEAFLIQGPGDGSYFLTEISKKDISKITKIKTDKFIALPFNKGKPLSESF